MWITSLTHNSEPKISWNLHNPSCNLEVAILKTALSLRVSTQTFVYFNGNYDQLPHTVSCVTFTSSSKKNWLKGD